MYRSICLAAAGVLLLGATQHAQALDLLTTTGSGPVGNCQAALPVFEGLIRKRPLAVVNESDAPAFVTCALANEEVSLNVQSFSTRISNSSTAPVTVTCTAVVGDELATASYIPKSITLAGGTAGNLTWSGADAGGLLTSKSIALSCRLPPMAALNRNRITTLLSLI
ncbi:hypothetical protein WCE34_12010 [Luteimonas sp. MJ204]|uniref:hypothetical protein n=1 Tax=Luteimonas sp. MJ145 TaxID=3129234 RepID=UPI0031BB8B6B